MLTLGINASRARSGGAQAHLIGILSEADPLRHGFETVHVWAFPELCDRLPVRPWLIRHSPRELRLSLMRQLFWERFSLPKALRASNCAILFNVDAGTVCRFRPAVTMSQDMLSYEPGAARKFGFGRAQLRLAALRYVQNASLRAADGAIFLTHYAASVIQSSTGLLDTTALIPHGIDRDFHEMVPAGNWPKDGSRPIRCLYISNTEHYKHQWEVVRACEALRNRGHTIELMLVGGGSGKAQRRLETQLKLSDPLGQFVTQFGFVSREGIRKFLGQSDLFIFASSCETMPVTLLEAMAAGLPIASSDRGPMPEVLAETAVYFDPEDSESIAGAIESLINDGGLREALAAAAKYRSQTFQWRHCATATLEFIRRVIDGSRS